jgi:hypothetical protein
MALKELDVELVLSVIGFTVWLVRLEGKTHANEKANIETQKDVDTLRSKHESLDSKIIDQLGAVRESLARLEGRLGIKQEGD